MTPNQFNTHTHTRARAFQHTFNTPQFGKITITVAPKFFHRFIIYKWKETEMQELKKSKFFAGFSMIFSGKEHNSAFFSSKIWPWIYTITIYKWKETEMQDSKQYFLKSNLSQTMLQYLSYCYTRRSASLRFASQRAFLLWVQLASLAPRFKVLPYSSQKKTASTQLLIYIYV